MACLIQLSQQLIVNLDAVSVLRYEDGQWLVFFHDHAHALSLTPDEALVLQHYITKHTIRLSYIAVRREQGRGRYQEPVL